MALSSYSFSLLCQQICQPYVGQHRRGRRNRSQGVLYGEIAPKTFETLLCKCQSQPYFNCSLVLQGVLKPLKNPLKSLLGQYDNEHFPIRLCRQASNLFFIPVSVSFTFHSVTINEKIESNGQKKYSFIDSISFDSKLTGDEGRLKWKGNSHFV